MNEPVSIDDIIIRTKLQPGDIGYITYLHGTLYQQEYSYGMALESYVAAGLHEFYSNDDPAKDCVWICEHNNSTVGFLLLMHRDKTIAQLRYFILLPAYRGIGLGKKLMRLFIDVLKSHNYTSAYLWTTHELTAAATLYTRLALNSQKKNIQPLLANR